MPLEAGIRFVSAGCPLRAGMIFKFDSRGDQRRTPEQLYDTPATPFVYGFIGNVNLFHGRAHEVRLHVGDDIILEAAEHAMRTTRSPLPLRGRMSKRRQRWYRGG